MPQGPIWFPDDEDPFPVMAGKQGGVVVFPSGEAGVTPPASDQVSDAAAYLSSDARYARHATWRTN